MFVKVCGTTNPEDAQLAVALGADALGFIFAPSRRQVSLEQAAEITRRLPSPPPRVGVFTEPEIDWIAHAVRDAGLTAVQMHWAHDARGVQALSEALGSDIALWQVVGFAIHPGDESKALRDFAQRLRAAMLDPRVDVVLLDAMRGNASGGLGEAFAWSKASDIVQTAKAAAEQAALEHGHRAPRLVVAGGLTAENVGEALATLHPWGVDVVSGVEAVPGRKDPDRLRRFIDAARDAAERVSPA